LEFLPNSDRVAAFALIVKAVNSVDLCAFVVSSEQEEVFLVLDFVGEKENNNFETGFATVDIISQEEVVGFWGESSIFKQTKKIGELSMNISANFDWGFELKENGLLHKDFTSDLADLRNILLFDLFFSVAR
jgi:hypothetical protein